MNDVPNSFIAALGLLAHWDSAVWPVVARSLAVSGLACALALGVGVGMGALLGVARFRGRGVCLVVLNASLALPSVVVGLLVYLLLSRGGPLGAWGWLFSFKAMVLAQALLVLPVAVALTRHTVESAERRHGEQLQSIGLGNVLRAGVLAWDERQALLMVAMACFGRAIAEVGAVMVVGGNIEGFTRVMTTTIALETSKGDLPMALALGLVLMTVVLALHGAMALLKHLSDRAAPAWTKQAV